MAFEVSIHSKWGMETVEANICNKGREPQNLEEVREFD